MKVAVRYYSKTGNTKKLADAISEAVGTEAATVDSPINEYVDILFLGASVYYGGIDKKIKSFIDSLKTDKIGKVVVFSTSSLTERAFFEIEKLLKQNGVNVEKDNFYCRGKFKFLYKNRPNEDDCKSAARFAQKFLV